LIFDRVELTLYNIAMPSEATTKKSNYDVVCVAVELNNIVFRVNFIALRDDLPATTL